jgi:DNA polymerase-1
MPDTYLLIDVSGLVHRNFHAMGDLSYEGVKTGAVFGFFRDVLDLQETFQTNHLVFCFDVGPSKRRELLPGYKAGRKQRRDEQTEEEREAFGELYRQMDRIRMKYLPYIGYRNLLWKEGYEADDVIASVCLSLAKLSWMDKEENRDRVVVVSSDSDMLQLVDRKNTVVWNPRTKRPVDEKAFIERYGIKPFFWSRVKAIGGCVSDDIPGVPGVGEKTAIKYLRGELKTESKAFQSIQEHVKEIELYHRLTRLPFEGTGTFPLQPDVVTPRRWERALDKLGIDSLRGRAAGVKKR